MLQGISLSERIEESIQSGQPGLWIRTHEPDEALKTLVDLAKQYSPDAADPDASIWVLKIWDIVSGLQTANHVNPIQEGKPESSLAAVKALIAVCEERRQRLKMCDEEHPEQLPPEDSHNIVLVLRNGHREFVNNGATNKEMLMATQHLLALGKAFRCHLVVMSFPGVEVPLELVEQLWVLDHELPDYDTRQTIITELLDCHGAKIPKADRLDIIVKATGGLTRGQVEGISALSLMKHDKIMTSDVWRLKAESLNKRGLLTLWKGEDKFDSIGGLQGVKLFCKRALKPGKPANLQARAALLLGVPGTGKSALCKAVGNEMNRPTLSLDIGGLMGSLVGQTEERTREALAIADAMEPCQLFLD